jgi:riboflavin synthase
MRIGIVEVLGADKVNGILEKEFEKEVSTIEIKRYLVPTIDDAALGARILLEDQECDFAVVGYYLEEDERLSEACQTSIIFVQSWLKKHIFRVIVPADREIEDYAKAAAKEVIRYFYKPSELGEEKSEMGAGAGEEEETPAGVFEAFSKLF